MGRRKSRHRLAKLLETEISIPRRVLLVFAGLVVIFGIAFLASYMLPESPIVGLVVSVLALPPAFLLLVVGASLSAPLQLFVDVYFLFVAVPYWLLLAYAISAAFERIRKLM